MQFNPHNNFSVPQQPQEVEKTKHCFVLKGDVVKDGFFETERGMTFDQNMGSVTTEYHSLHQLGCKHVIGTPEQLAGNCGKCDSSMCQACQIRCSKCLCLTCPSCTKISDGKAFCKKCSMSHNLKQCFISVVISLHELFKKEF
jgi:hypothetical protein